MHLLLRSPEQAALVTLWYVYSPIHTLQTCASARRDVWSEAGHGGQASLCGAKAAPEYCSELSCTALPMKSRQALQHEAAHDATACTLTPRARRVPQRGGARLVLPGRFRPAGRRSQRLRSTTPNMPSLRTRPLSEKHTMPARRGRAPRSARASPSVLRLPRSSEQSATPRLRTSAPPAQEQPLCAPRQHTHPPGVPPTHTQRREEHMCGVQDGGAARGVPSARRRPSPLTSAHRRRHAAGEAGHGRARGGSGWMEGV